MIFDLDETLVHCVESVENCDATIEIQIPGGEAVRAGLNIRPFALECLTYAARHFEVAIFTASHQCYADVVLNLLDPTGTLISHRLYRDNCVQTEGLFIKDLRILENWDLNDVVLVDNASYSFAF